MKSSIMAAFTKHPNSVGESYSQHCYTALSFAARMLIASGACFVHAIFPFICVKTGSKAIAELNQKMLVQREHQKPN